MLDVAKIIPEIENICRGTSVQRLDLFGSALTERYSSENTMQMFSSHSITTTEWTISQSIST